MFGGFHGNGGNNMESIAINNILNNAWTVSSATFPEVISYPNAVTYGTDIYVMNGYDPNGVNSLSDSVYIVDSIADTITLSPDVLSFPNGGAAVIIFNNVIYSFGGRAGTDRWQKYQLAPGLPS